MSNFKFGFVEPGQISLTLSQFCLGVRQLAAEHRKKTQAEDQKVISSAFQLIATGMPVAEWDARTCEQLLQLGFAVMRDLLAVAQESPEPLSARMEELLWMSDVACSIAAAHRQVPALMKSKLCGLWIRIRLMSGWRMENPDDFVNAVKRELAPVGLSEDALEKQAQAQLVNYLAHLTSRGGTAQELTEWARQQCSTLVQLAEMRGMLANAAKKLGLVLPTAKKGDEKGGTPAAAREEPVPAMEQPTILEAPAAISDDRLPQLRQEILAHLRLYSSGNSSLLSQMTKSQVNRLKIDSSEDAFGQVYYYAGGDLWNAYWTSGQDAGLPLLRDIAQYLYSAAVRQSGKEQKRASSLHLGVIAQLPEKLRTCEIDHMLAEARRLFRIAKCRPNELTLRRSIIEAFAGECRRLERKGETEEQSRLLQEYSKQLHTVHQEYRDRESVGRGKTGDDEALAWDYLFPPAPRDAEVTTPQVIRKILDDPAFHKVINRGDHDETHQFIAHHREWLQELLQARLKVHIGPDHVMKPQGRVIQARGTTRDQVDPRFADALRAIQGEDYQHAERMLESLVDRVEGRNREIASNFLAYVQARCGNPMRARMQLNPLCNAKFTYAAAYWNLACCLSSNQMDQQLEALAKGLEVAPRPRLLNGAVYLAMMLHDDHRLRKWLPCLTLTEAHALCYHLEYEELDPQGREAYLMRLAS